MAANEMFTREDDINRKNEEVIQRLIELFGNVLDLEIIQSVALNCNCNMETTSNILLEMSSSIGAVPKKPKEGKKNKEKSNFSYAATVHSQLSRDANADVIIESEKIINCLPGAMGSSLYSVPSPKKVSSQSQRKSKKEQEFDRVVLHVRQGSRILILMRGLPGSGKSYLAKEIVDKGIGYQNYETFILSSDDYFINKRTGVYEYDRNKIQEAHEWNQQRAYKSMSKGISPVIIDNTNSQMWEMKSYAMMATNFGYKIEIVEPFTYWAFNDKELSRRNRHGVPKLKIKEMLDRFEKNVTPAKLLAVYNLSYNSHCKPPVSRTYPPIPYSEMQYMGVADTVLNPFAVSSLTNRQNHVSITEYEKKNNFQSNNEHKEAVYSTMSEAVDLMDFESESPIYISDDDNDDDNNKPDEQEQLNPLDSILNMPTNNVEVLEPSVWNLHDKHNFISSVTSEPKIKKTCTYSINAICSGETELSQETAASKNLDNEFKTCDDIGPTNYNKTAVQINKMRNMYPNLDLSSWGLPENAMSSWQSWDVVTPLNHPEEYKGDSLEHNSNYKPSTSKQTSDSATNTSSSDFVLLNNEYMIYENLKILKTRSRDINIGTVVCPPMSPPRKTLLDKSSMTNDDVLSAALSRERNSNVEKQIEELIALFPNIPVDYLRDVYEKCKNDLNWTVDLLLDDNREILQSLKINRSPEESENEGRSSNNNYLIEKQEAEGNDNLELFQANVKELKTNIDKTNENANDQITRSLSKEVIELKRHIEENVEIDKNFYSNHILKIKNQRRRITSEPSYCQQSDKPCTSRAGNFDAHFTSKGEIIAVNSDVDLDDFEPDIDFPQSDDSEEEMVELNLGNVCVSQLEAKFGFPEVFPQGFQPVVQVPAWLAGQLHAFYVESIFGQMEAQNQVLEMIVKEDEEFAKKLQMQEEALQVTEDRSTPNLKKIMEDEQIASNIYKKQTEEWKKLTPDDLAAKLTRQKLFSAFPTLDETLLTEILHAHGNSYEQTIEVLLASTEQDKIIDPDGTIREPPITEAIVNEMKKAEEETKASSNTPDTPKSATEYREEASMHLKKHKELIQKAQQAYQRKQYPVAQFYSDLAKTYTQLYDQANGLAAMAFLDEHSKKLQNYHTLDLHYLYVKEAVEALDIFIDNNIRLLHGTNKKCENLFVITGRGKRSDQGRSRLKPAVMARLRKRNIWYCEMNPGLLKVRVRPTSAITSNLL